MRTGTRWRGLPGGRGLPVLALVLTLGLGGCAFEAHEIDDGEVVALEEWLEQRPEVDEVSTERGTAFRAGLPGEDEWARIRVVVDPGTTSDELLALGQELRERDEPRTITGEAEVHVGGLSFVLGVAPETDARTVELLVLMQDALGEIRPLPAPASTSDNRPHPVTISNDITLWVDWEDLDAATGALARIEPPGGTAVEVQVLPVSVSSSAPPDLTARSFVLGGDGESPGTLQPVMSAVSILEEAGLQPTLSIGPDDVAVVEVFITSPEQWDLTVDTMDSTAPDAVLRAVLGPETVPGVDAALRVELPLSAIGAEDARRLPDLLGSPPSPWQVTRVAVSDENEDEDEDEGQITATLDGRHRDLADLEALASVPDWPLSEVVDAYRFSWVEDGTLDDDTTLVLPSTAGADLSFLDVYRAADRAGRVDPDVEVVFDGTFRLSWPEGTVGPEELRPVLEELRGDWGPQRVSVTQGDEATLVFDTTGSGTATDESTSSGISPEDRRDELGWVVELWDETADG